MGRKGVSKRKPQQTKNKQSSRENIGAGVPSVGRAIGSQLVKSPEIGQAIAPAARGNTNRSSDSRKNSKRR